MAISASGLIMPKFGALFTAAEFTSPLASIADFTLLAPPSGGVWTHWGHLSRDTLPEHATEGGETTAAHTWLQMNTDSETEDSVDSVTYSPVQNDAVTIAAMAALNGAKVSAVELWYSGTKRFAAWWPSVKVALTGRPSAGGTDQYAASKVRLTILSPTDMSPALSTLGDPAGGKALWPSTTAPNTLYLDNTAFAVTP